MPCDGSYLDPNDWEIEYSRIHCMLAELAGGKFNKKWWDGYHPKAYMQNITRAKIDALVAQLCRKLQKVDVSKYSLELQMWWRDHQKADKRRVQEELRRKKSERDRAKLIARLTPYERKLLGL